VDGFELNLSCPHGLPERKMGMAMGEDPSLVQEVCGWVKEVARIPVWAKMTPNVGHVTEPAGAALKAGVDGISAINTILSIIGVDLRTLRPMDSATVVESVKKTGRCVVVEEGWPQSGIGAEIAARIMEQAFDYLDAPVGRVSGKDVPMPYAANLEKLALPSVAEVVEAAKAVCYR